MPNCNQQVRRGIIDLADDIEASETCVSNGIMGLGSILVIKTFM